MAKLKLIRIGDSIGLILPEELLKRLRVGEGDSLYVVGTERGVELAPYRPEVAGQTEAAERVMREDHAALRKLAE